MKQLLYMLFLFIASINAQTQDKGEVTYLDFNHKPTAKENAAYYEFKTPYKNDIIKYQKYFIASATKAFLVEKYYLDEEDRKQGKYNSYFKDGILMTEGIYKDDLKFGPWKKYMKAPDTKIDSVDNSVYLQSTKYYKEDKRNGKFKETYEDGSLQGEGQYKDDNLYGECKWYHRNGQMSSLEFYDEKGKLKKIQQWEENGEEKHKKLKPNHDLSERKRNLHYVITKELSIKMNKNIYKMYPNQYGKIYVQILLDKNGKIHIIKTKSTSGISLEYENEIKRVLSNMAIQKPIYYHNQLTEVKFTIPIKIYPRPSNL